MCARTSSAVSFCTRPAATRTARWRACRGSAEVGARSAAPRRLTRDALNALPVRSPLDCSAAMERYSGNRIRTAKKSVGRTSNQDSTTHSLSRRCFTSPGVRSTDEASIQQSIQHCSVSTSSMARINVTLTDETSVCCKQRSLPEGPTAPWPSRSPPRTPACAPGCAARPPPACAPTPGSAQSPG